MTRRILSIVLALAICLAFIPITAFAAATLVLDKTSYTAGEKIIVTYSGITEEQETAQAWVGIAKSGDAASNYLDWQYIKQGTGVVKLDSPSEKGSYEVRFYQGSTADDTTLVKNVSVPFTINNSSDGGNSKGGSTEQGQESNTVVRYPVKEEFDWSLVNFATGIHSFTGTFETDWGTLSMIKTGNKVTGKYTHDNGRIDGTILDGVLYGYWYESPSYAPPEDAGQIVFVMNKDGKNFTGWWRYGNSGVWTLWSRGTRNEQETSGWASEEAAKADAFGLIPKSLKGADLTKPITREEFAELSVCLYEVYTGQKAEAAPDNTFTDCKNPEVLKASKLGIVNGVGNKKYDPKSPISREQIAAMLNRAVKVIASNSDLSTSGAPTFKDEKSITPYFLENVKFMAKKEFIRGSNGLFSPKGTCTREMAVIIVARVFEHYKK